MAFYFFCWPQHIVNIKKINMAYFSAYDYDSWVVVDEQ